MDKTKECKDCQIDIEWEQVDYEVLPKEEETDEDEYLCHDCEIKRNLNRLYWKHLEDRHSRGEQI
jgi:hypothetical protein